MWEVHPIVTHFCGFFPACCCSFPAHTWLPALELVPHTDTGGCCTTHTSHLLSPESTQHSQRAAGSWNSLSLLPLPSKRCLQLRPRTSHLLRKRSCIVLGAPGRSGPSGRGMAQAAPVFVLPPRFCVFRHFPGPGAAGEPCPAPRTVGGSSQEVRHHRGLPPPVRLPPAPGAAEPPARIPTPEMSRKIAMKAWGRRRSRGDSGNLTDTFERRGVLLGRIFLPAEGAYAKCRYFWKGKEA